MLCKFVESSDDGVYGRFVGQVKDVRCTKNGWRATLAVVSLQAGEARAAGDGLLLYIEETPTFAPGDWLLGEGDVYAFAPATNPGQFDQRAYYGAMKLDAWCRPARLKVQKEGNLFLAKQLYALRRYLVECLDAVGQMGDASGWQEMVSILQGMLLGERALVGEESTEAFELGGISHLLAISGLHISMIGMSMFRALKKRLGLPYGAAVFASAVIVLTYCAMTGRTASSARALYMFVVMLVGEMLERPYDMMSACALAGLFVLAESPLLLFQAAFQLSFLAIVGIGLLQPAIVKITQVGEKGASLWVGAAAQLAVLPVLAWHFYEFTAAGLWMNLLVLPVTPFLAGVGFAGMAVSCLSVRAGAIVLMPVYYMLEAIQVLCHWIGELPGMQVCLGRPTASALLGYVGFWGIVIGLGGRLRGRRPGKWARLRQTLLIAAAIGSVFLLGHRSAAGLQMTILDVGQGDGILLQLPTGETVMIDGGSSDVKQVGEYRLAPCLAYYGVDQVDFWIVTHVDADHTSGLKALVEAGFPVRQILISDAESAEGAHGAWEAWAEVQGVDVQRVSAGQGLHVGEVKLTCLYPAAGAYVEEENDTSLVLWLEYGEFAALLTGDLGETYEDAVIQQLVRRPKQQVLLKVGHHGSQYSTSEALLEALQPTWAVISCGARNRYGHPHAALVERLEAACTVLSTPKSGAIQVETDGQRVEVVGFCR